MIWRGQWRQHVSASDRSCCRRAWRQCWHRRDHAVLSTNDQRSQTLGVWRYRTLPELRPHHGNNCNISGWRCWIKTSNTCITNSLRLQTDLMTAYWSHQETQLSQTDRCTDEISEHWIGLSSVLCPRQHSIGYIGDGFYRSKNPTNSIKVLKEHIVDREINSSSWTDCEGHSRL